MKEPAGVQYTSMLLTAYHPTLNGPMILSYITERIATVILKEAAL